MKIPARLPLVAFLSGLIAIGAASCAPGVQDMNLSPVVFDRLPEAHALRFLQTLRPSPLGYVHCRFEKDGVQGWLPHQRRVSSVNIPYRALMARPKRPGIMIVIVLYHRGQPWCTIPAESNADRLGRRDYEQFTGKILTALLSLGVEVRAYDQKVQRSSRPVGG